METLTEEEEAMAETITQLQDAHRCSDKACTSRFCFVGNPSASHVRLTPLHLKTWSAAILAKTPGVSVDMPPGPNEEKMFWPAEAQSDDVDDIAMLAARRRSASAKPASTSSVTINNDFAGLAAIFQPFLTGAASASASHSQPQAPRSPSRPAPLPSTSASPLKPTRLTIAEFCTAFDLGPDILDQLTPMKLAGPHVLEFVENEILDKYLEIGQRVSVRYAEAQWKKGKAGF